MNTNILLKAGYFIRTCSLCLGNIVTHWACGMPCLGSLHDPSHGDIFLTLWFIFCQVLVIGFSIGLGAIPWVIMSEVWQHYSDQFEEMGKINIFHSKSLECFVKCKTRQFKASACWFRFRSPCRWRFIHPIQNSKMEQETSLHVI